MTHVRAEGSSDPKLDFSSNKRAVRYILKINGIRLRRCPFLGLVEIPFFQSVVFQDNVPVSLIA